MTIDPDIRAMAEALNRIDQYGSLGRVSLAQGRAVSAELTHLELDDTPFQRGRILSRAIRAEVRRQFEQRKDDAAGRDVAEWTILYLRVQDGLSLQQIGERLHIPLRSVARYYARAKELLLDRMYSLDEGQVSTEVYCPLCGTRSESSLEATPTSTTCRGCDADLEVQWDGSSTVGIHAHRS